LRFTGLYGPSRLKFHYEIVLGKMLQPKAKTPVDRELPYLRAANILDGRIDADDLKTMWFAPSEIAKYDVKPGDLFILEGGDVGRGAIWDSAIANVGFQNSVHRIRPLPGNSNRFALYWFNHLKSVGYFDLISSKATLAHFTGEKAKETPFPEVDLPTQKRIAEFLDRETARINQLIENRKAFLDLISEKRTALTIQAMDGTILGAGHDGEEGWFGHLPRDWPVWRAKFLFREGQECSATGEEELLTVSHITGVTPRSDKDVNMFLADTMEGYKLVSRGDVVVNTMWAWMGAMGVSPVSGLISPSYGVYTPTVDAFEPNYLDLILRSLPFIAEVNRRSKGVWSSRLRLYPDAFLDIRLPVPAIEVQQESLNALQTMIHREEQLADLSRQSLDCLREFRSALITAAVTGHIDVETWGRRGDTDRRLDVIEEELSV